MVGLVESNTVISIDGEVASVYVVAFHDHFENLRLVNSTLLHEVDNLILHHHGVIDVVIKLNLHLVL